jgi:hypothetical protein
LNADERGHFMLEAAINGRRVTVMANTGATLVVLSYEDAERLGLAPRSLDFLRAGSDGQRRGPEWPRSRLPRCTLPTSRCATSLPSPPNGARLVLTSSE